MIGLKKASTSWTSGIREIHVVLKMPADEADPAGEAEAPDEQEPDPEGDEQEPEGDEQENTEEETMDFDKFVQMNQQQAEHFEKFVQD